MTIRKTRVEKLEARTMPGTEYVVASNSEELEQKIEERLRDTSRKSSKLVGIITGVPRAN